jgi:hypothetical protein
VNTLKFYKAHKDGTFDVMVIKVAKTRSNLEAVALAARQGFHRRVRRSRVRDIKVNETRRPLL